MQENSLSHNFHRTSQRHLRQACGIVFGIATTKKIAVTLSDVQVDEIRAVVAGRRSPNISALITHAVGIAVSDVVGWREMLADALRQTGGPLTKKERAWADKILVSKTKKRRRQAQRAAELKPAS